MEHLKGLDSQRLPIIGSKWKFHLDNGEAPLTVVKISNDLVYTLDQHRKPWTGRLSSFREGRYTLLEVPSGKEGTNVEQTTKSLDRKLGLDKDGKPIIGSIWNGAVEGWPRETSFFKIDRIGSTLTDLSKRLQDGSFTRGGHGWNTETIASKWELVSIPDPDAIPTLVIRKKQGLAYEQLMRECEKAGKFESAREYAEVAAKYSKIDFEMLAEEKAVADKRVIREIQLKKLDTGDRRLFEARVKLFVHYTDQMVGWFWWE